VLSIDLGASFTKVAWRPRWNFIPTSEDRQNDYKAVSQPVKIGGELFIASVGYDPGNGCDWLFGRGVANIVPSQEGRLHRNWKSRLFDSHLPDEDVEDAIDVARRFLSWVRSAIIEAAPDLNLSEARTRFCIPAFQDFQAGASRLRKAAENAGWPDHDLLFTEEPAANTIGLASVGRNDVNVRHGADPVVNLANIYDPNSPLVRAAQNAVNQGTNSILLVIDIGAFTTDLAVCEVTDDVRVKKHVSHKHGVAELDKHLETCLQQRGVEFARLPIKEFEEAKMALYQGQDHPLTQNRRSIMLEADCMTEHLGAFANKVLELGEPLMRDHLWFVLTGGGAEISAISNLIREALLQRGFRDVQWLFRDQEQRIATALGGASVVLDFNKPLAVLPQQPLRPPDGMDCSCRGNPNCMRCWGTGWIPASELVQRPQPTPQRVVRVPGTLEPGQMPTVAPVVEPPFRRAPTQALPVRRGEHPSRPRVISPSDSKTLDVQELVDSWSQRSSGAEADLTLQGWMGGLVFSKALLPKEQKSTLEGFESSHGKAAWLRLLCLGSLRGVRMQHGLIQRFWWNDLHDVWAALIPASLDSLKEPSYPRELERVFHDAIHRQFTDDLASGEDAELWRRVFYDFRKLHHFVYHNDLPRSLLELAGQQHTQSDSLLNFLRSGRVPGAERRWVGTIGQSMASPLFFILRELRRLEVIDERYEPACFYMNSPARRVACQLGWISAEQNLRYDIENLSEISAICYERTKRECPELLPFFDLPLQWYAAQH
jgi:hypothetical protein